MRGGHIQRELAVRVDHRARNAAVIHAVFDAGANLAHRGRDR